MPSNFLGDFKTLSSIQLTYNLLLRCGLMNQEGRPWTLIIATYHGVMCTLLGVLCVVTNAFLINANCHCYLRTSAINSPNETTKSLIQGLALALYRQTCLSFLGVKVYMEMENFSEILQPCIVSIADIHVLAKFVNILVNQTKIRSLFNQLEQLRQQELEDPVYASQITKVDNFTKTLIYHLNLYIHLYPFISTVFNVINDYLSAAEKPSFALPMWMPWNYQKSWPYVAALITSALIVLSAAILYSTFYSLLFAITFQMSVLLKILQAKMEVTKANDRSIFYQHVNILQLLKQYNELFSGQYYLEIMISSIQPCGFCYMMIKNLKSGDSRWLDSLFKFSYTLTIPVLLCGCGEEINTQVEKLHESSYRSSWYQEQPTARKDLLILMTVTSRPFLINYKGLITFNLVCLATVMQGFYSYITMLINFTNE